MLKLDLHTHSTASHDGGISEKAYKESIAKSIVDVVAITDHNRIDIAQKLHKELGDNIIIGEEIMTKCGEVIGLFLTVKVGPHQSLARTIQMIHKQGGLVYIPHPFDTWRHGIGKKNLLKYRKEIDIVEGFNGRVIWREQNAKAREFAVIQKIPIGIGSDAHGSGGLGNCYMQVKEQVTVGNLKKVLRQGTPVTKYQPIFEFFRPKWNKFRRLLYG